MNEVDIYQFPTDCWDCSNTIEVVIPERESLDNEVIGEAVLDAGFGSIERTYSKTQDRETIGNICPACGAYQGNGFLGRDFALHANSGGEYEVIATLTVQLVCLDCGVDVDDFRMQCERCRNNEQERRQHRHERRLEERGRDCYVCEDTFLVLLTHHTSYYPEETVEVCGSCHGKIHQRPGFRDDLKPDRDRPDGYRGA